MDKSFKNGCVLVVGGSGGIGSLCAQEFAKSGARVAITYYKNEQAAIDLANEINNDVIIYQLDNSDSKLVKETFKKVAKDHGSINTLVNAAGFDIPQKFISEIDIDLWKGVIDADINGFFNLIKTGLPYLRESRGSIVFISSAGLFKYPPGDILSVVSFGTFNIASFSATAITSDTLNSARLPVVPIDKVELDYLQYQDKQTKF